MQGRALHWLSALAAAVALLAAAFPAVTTGAGSAYKVTNSRKGSAVFRAGNVAPGGGGSGRVVLRNAGTRPVRIQLTQDRVVNTGLGASLQLQLHDATRNQCIYPARTSRGPCTSYGRWRAGSRLSRKLLLSKRGRTRWPAREAHTIVARWRLHAASPNTDQGRVARFRLVWRASA